MTYQEYEKNIKEIISKPDTAMVDIGAVLESLKTDLEGAVSLTSENEALKDRIRDLQDTNAKLFLGVTGKETKENDTDDEFEDLEGAEALEAFAKKIVNKKEGE